LHYQIVNYKTKLQNQSTAGSIEVTDCKMIQSLFELTAYIANAVNTINGEKVHLLCLDILVVPASGCTLF